MLQSFDMGNAACTTWLLLTDCVFILAQYLAKVGVFCRPLVMFLLFMSILINDAALIANPRSDK